MPKKNERGNLWDFLTSILLQNIKEIEGEGPLVKGGAHLVKQLVLVKFLGPNGPI